MEDEEMMFIETELDLIHIDDGFLLNYGRWDQVEVHLSEVVIEGEAEEAPFIAVLSDVFLLQASNLVLNQQSYVLELGRPGWITPESFEGVEVEEDGELIIEPESEVTERLIDALHLESVSSSTPMGISSCQKETRQCWWPAPMKGPFPHQRRRSRSRKQTQPQAALPARGGLPKEHSSLCCCCHCCSGDGARTFAAPANGDQLKQLKGMALGNPANGG